MTNDYWPEEIESQRRRFGATNSVVSATGDSAARACGYSGIHDRRAHRDPSVIDTWQGYIANRCDDDD